MPASGDVAKVYLITDPLVKQRLDYTFPLKYNQFRINN